MKSITCKFIGATNTKPARIKASDGDNTHTVGVHSDPPSIPKAYFYKISEKWLAEPERRAAIGLALKLEWRGKLIQGGTKDGSVFVFLPHDAVLATRGRLSGDVIDLDALAQAFGKTL